MGQIVIRLEPRVFDSHVALGLGIAAQQEVGRTPYDGHVAGHVSRRCR